MRDELEAMLERVRRGELEPRAALDQLGGLPFRDLGFARADLHRELRQGAPEAILAEGKTTAQVVAIARAMVDGGASSVLVTRADEAARRAVREELPEAQEHPDARLVWVARAVPEPRGLVTIVSAGTSDGPVVQEARIRAELLGTEVIVHEDAGVAGLHRLASVLPDLERADCVVVVAGMDGALASVVGGLVAAPVIGVPTSVGYGVADGGRTALHSMLSSCAAALAVVGIDDGLGAGTIAARIARGPVLIAYLDCVGGLAGDMLIAALLDAGAPVQTLRELPARLGLTGIGLRIERVQRHGIGALHLAVETGGHDDHPHRSWRTIREQLMAAELDERLRARAIAVFTRLAEVEGAIHAVPPEDIHFHELGSVDTMIDIVGAVALLDALDVDRVICSPLPLGRGVIDAAHGRIPLPAPATVALLSGAPVVGVEVEAELVTPTGAALAATLADAWGEIPSMTLERTGYGAGTADFGERANVVRVLLGRAAGVPGTREVSLLETNLDDLTPELVPDAIEGCFAAGALDVWTAPVAMKKGRPGFVLSALVRPEAEAAVARTILEQTTALGVRVARLRRYELEREQLTVEVEGGPVRIKLGRLDGRIVNVAPEHDDCAAVASTRGVPVKSIWAAAMAVARELSDLR